MRKSFGPSSRAVAIQASASAVLSQPKRANALRMEETNCVDGVLLQRVVTYLSTHYTEDIKLCQLAKLFGYNEKYLSHTLHS